jgi:hypothetical protein
VPLEELREEHIEVAAVPGDGARLENRLGMRHERGKNRNIFRRHRGEAKWRSGRFTTATRRGDGMKWAGGELRAANSCDVVTFEEIAYYVFEKTCAPGIFSLEVIDIENGELVDDSCFEAVDKRARA